MKAVVVDENVPIVANDSGQPQPRAPQADTACRLACVQMLRNIVKSGIVVIDDAGSVLKKYREYLDGRGQPGVGDAFFKHVCDNQFNRRRVRRTKIIKNAAGEFESFPTTPEMAGFDHSDRIFIALALTAPEQPTIVNAVDRDYASHKAALDSNHVVVKEVCPHCIHLRPGD